MISITRVFARNIASPHRAGLWHLGVTVFIDLTFSSTTLTVKFLLFSAFRDLLATERDDNSAEGLRGLQPRTVLHTDETDH